MFFLFNITRDKTFRLKTSWCVWKMWHYLRNNWDCWSVNFPKSNKTEQKRSQLFTIDSLHGSILSQCLQNSSHSQSTLPKTHSWTQQLILHTEKQTRTQQVIRHTEIKTLTTGCTWRSFYGRLWTNSLNTKNLFLQHNAKLFNMRTNLKTGRPAVSVICEFFICGVLAADVMMLFLKYVT